MSQLRNSLQAANREGHLWLGPGLLTVETWLDSCSPKVALGTVPWESSFTLSSRTNTSNSRHLDRILTGSQIVAGCYSVIRGRFSCWRASQRNTVSCFLMLPRRYTRRA